MPSLREVALSDAFLDPAAKPARSSVFIDGIDALRAFPRVSTWPEIEDAADVVIEQGMFGELTLEQVIAQLEERTAAAFFVVGALKSRFAAQSWWLSGLETVGLGGAAATIAYAIGAALETIVG